jgi:hypothetical protein
VVEDDDDHEVADEPERKGAGEQEANEQPWGPISKEQQEVAIAMEEGAVAMEEAARSMRVLRGQLLEEEGNAAKCFVRTETATALKKTANSMKEIASALSASVRAFPQDKDPSQVADKQGL